MTPILAGLAMAMSSVTVVGNSMLLGRYKPRFTNKNQKEKNSLLTKVSQRLFLYKQPKDNNQLN
jgi:hypothetical protein